MKNFTTKLILFSSFLMVGCTSSSAEKPDFDGVKLGMTKELIPRKYNISTCKLAISGGYLDSEVGIEDIICVNKVDNFFDTHFIFLNKKLIGFTTNIGAYFTEREAVHTAIMNKFGKNFDVFITKSVETERDTAGTCFSIQNCTSWRWLESKSFEVRYAAERGAVPMRFALFDRSQDSLISDLISKAEKDKKEAVKKKADQLKY